MKYFTFNRKSSEPETIISSCFNSLCDRIHMVDMQGTVEEHSLEKTHLRLIDLRLICLDTLLHDIKNQDCLVYSFGIGNDWTFEESMASLGMRVKSFFSGDHK